MAEEDGDTWYCYYAVMKLKWQPAAFANLPPRERALMYAFIDRRMEDEKKQQAKMKAKNSRKPSRGGRRRR